MTERTKTEINMKTTKRRTFLKKAAMVAVGAVAASRFAAPAIAKDLYEWKMVLTWQKVLPGLGTGAVRLANRITQLSGGRLKVHVYGGGELVPPQAVFDAVSAGTAEMGHSAPYYWLSKSKASAFFCAVPGGLTAQEQNGWIYFGGGQQLWDELYGQFGLQAFPAGNTGVQMGGWFNKELKSLADLKGLKMRMPGLAGEVFTKLGGSAQTIPPQELYTAMQSGVIDATEWVGPWNDMSLGFHRVASHYYGPAYQEGGPTLELMVNKKAFESLPKDLQAVVRCAAATENTLMAAEYHANNVRAFQDLRKEGKVVIAEYPDDILDAFFTTSKEMVAEVANAGSLEKRIYESYLQYKKMSLDYEPTTELGYLKARHRAGV